MKNWLWVIILFFGAKVHGAELFPDSSYVQKGLSFINDLSKGQYSTAAGLVFAGKYKTPTLRNVDRRPRPDFVKAYMQNGYMKSLREVVHFYNTRDALPRCNAGDAGEKVSCWPAPEHPETMNRKQLGNLGLSSAQEESIVAFLQTLTDGYRP